MKLLLFVSIVMIFVGSAMLARAMAARRGLNPVFWAVLGFAFGPLVFPFIVLFRRRLGV